MLPLRLNPVDEMVACYGRALRVLSEQWPVMDGDEPVGPLRAMNEASRVVAENQIHRLTAGRLSVDDLDPETALALTAFGIWGLSDFAYDEALNLSRSLNIAPHRQTRRLPGGGPHDRPQPARAPAAAAGGPLPKSAVSTPPWCVKAPSCGWPGPRSAMRTAWPRLKPTGISSRG